VTGKLKLVLHSSENWSVWSYKFFLLPSVFNANVRHAVFAEDLEREVLDIGLDPSIIEFTANETLSIENAASKIISAKTARC